MVSLDESREESKAIQAIVNKAAIQAATAVVMALGEKVEGPRSATNMTSSREVHRQRHGRPALKQPSFKWNATDYMQSYLILKWRSQTYSS